MFVQDTSLEGRVALVTGGSRGIGRAICVALASRGAHIIVNYASREDAANDTARLIEDAGGKATLSRFDVGNTSEVNEAVPAAAKAAGGRLDIVVNNAGIARNGLLMRLKEDDWVASMNVNLAGAFQCTKAASRYLLKAKDGGRVINISSIVGEMGNGGQAVYAATKAGLIGFTKSLAREFASRGVCVNAVTPGYIATDMAAEQMTDEQRSALIDAIPLGRIGTSEDVANTVAFLAGPQAAYITGQVIRVNGGLLM